MISRTIEKILRAMRLQGIVPTTSAFLRSEFSKQSSIDSSDIANTSQGSGLSLDLSDSTYGHPEYFQIIGDDEQMTDPSAMFLYELMFFKVLRVLYY